MMTALPPDAALPATDTLIFARAPRSGSSSERHTLADLLVLMDAGPGELEIADDVPLLMRRVGGGQVLFHEGLADDFIHFVRGGTFKVFRTAEDGYEQVLGFAGRGELLGFDALHACAHPTSAVALENSSVYSLPVRDLAVLGARIPALHQVVHRAISNALTGRAQIADVMAAVAAEVRLARFLIHLSRQMTARGESPCRFHLRMGRRDIASYLGVAHETISRSFTELAHWGLLSVDMREIEILSMEGLQELSQSTRRHIDVSGRPLDRRQSSVRGVMDKPQRHFGLTNHLPHPGQANGTSRGAPGLVLAHPPARPSGAAT